MRTLAFNPVAKSFANIAISRGGTRPVLQCLSYYHSTTTLGNAANRVWESPMSSLVVPDDYRNYGYRVAYSTTTMTAADISEDYDEFTLHTSPSEVTHCDLGFVPLASSSDDVVLKFNAAGLVQPFWETEYPSSDARHNDWTGNSRNDDYSRVVTTKNERSNDIETEGLLEDNDIQHL